jgi:hypothetical protein
MTPADEARFLALYQQGATYRAIAQALGCALGTVAAWADALAADGKLTKRPHGGRQAGRRALTRPEDPPAPAPARAPAPASVPTREAPAITMVAVPELRELISRFSTLEARVAALEDGTRAGTRTLPAPASHPHPRTPGNVEQWTVRLSKTLIERIKAEAVAAEKPPSHVLEELAWRALNDRQYLPETEGPS